MYVSIYQDLCIPSPPQCAVDLCSPSEVCLPAREASGARDERAFTGASLSLEKSNSSVWSPLFINY